MTPGEALENALSLPQWRDLGGLDADTIYGELAMDVARIAIAAEREACAKAAESLNGDFERDTPGRTEGTARTNRAMSTYNEYSLRTLSQAAHTIASWRCAGKDDWNVCYPARLREIGFALIPVDDETDLGVYGPLWAPLPATGDNQYDYPCVIAPIGWTPTSPQ